MNVSIREFKAHLSSYLAKARGGDCIEITAHRKVVARIVGVPPAVEAGPKRLVAEGVAQWNGGKPKGAEVELPGEGKTVSQMVLEDRQ
jgi:prevent-host-death family protein